MSKTKIETKKPSLGKLIEAAQSQAILDAYAAGITDPEGHAKAMKAAREKVKADWTARKR